MKDIFEFNHIDKSLSESEIKTFTVITTKNIGVLSGLIRVINFLIIFLQSLEYAWLQLELFPVE